MKGGIEHLSERHLIEMSGDIEVQLERGAKQGFRPIALLLVKARQQAAAAITQLCLADPADSTAIKLLQNEVVRFDDLLKFCREIVQKGKEADRKLTNEEREEVQDLVMTPDWAPAEAGGYKQGHDA